MGVLSHGKHSQLLMMVRTGLTLRSVPCAASTHLYVSQSVRFHLHKTKKDQNFCFSLRKDYMLGRL